MSKCVYCGNNPTPHFINWINESTSVVMMPLNQALFGGKIGKLFFKYLSIIFSPLVYFLEKINAITYSDQLSDKTSSRAEVLWNEAQRRGIEMQCVKIFGKEK